jgi:hypothetical protein
VALLPLSLSLKGCIQSGGREEYPFTPGQNEKRWLYATAFQKLGQLADCAVRLA